MPTSRRRQRFQKLVKAGNAIDGSAKMAISLEIRLQLIQALPTGPHQVPREPYPTDHTNQRGSHTGTPHGHAPLQSQRGRPVRASET